MGFGSIASTSLESSNVDLAEEFASMILNQQALQANTKVVTTSNEMYQTALGVKT
jgi:flagellar hook protein FlgE